MRVCVDRETSIIFENQKKQTKHCMKTMPKSPCYLYKENLTPGRYQEIILLTMHHFESMLTIANHCIRRLSVEVRPQLFSFSYNILLKFVEATKYAFETWFLNPHMFTLGFFYWLDLKVRLSEIESQKHTIEICLSSCYWFYYKKIENLLKWWLKQSKHNFFELLC